MRALASLILVCSLFALPALASSQPASAGPRVLPRPDHVVVVIEENRAYSRIIGRPDAPYINALAARGALMTHSYAVSHPSLPNYLALLSGDTQGVVDDACAYEFSGPTLASELRAAGLSFATYSEGLPVRGFDGCGQRAYRRKHNPAVYWQAADSKSLAENLPFTAFPDDYSKLPAVAFVIPDLDHDMHDGGVADGDAWLHEHLDDYARWAVRHDSLLIVTWDEDDHTEGNRIATVIVGGPVRPGRYDEPLTHYGLLRTLQAMYGLGPIAHSADAAPLRSIWKR